MQPYCRVLGIYIPVLLEKSLEIQLKVFIKLLEGLLSDLRRWQQEERQ